MESSIIKVITFLNMIGENPVRVELRLAEAQIQVKNIWVAAGE
jgi:hypothetical protein